MIGDQLELALDDRRVSIPWNGISPRLLTKCGKLFSLKAFPTGGLHVVDPAQFTCLLKGVHHGS